MIERRRMCLDCGSELQEAGIRCVMMGYGGQGTCPRCGKRGQCYSWKVTRKDRRSRRGGGEES